MAVAEGVSPRVFFDDRLATVLRQRATGEAGLRTQYRQLLDLLGKDRLHPANAQHQSLVAAAWLRMNALAEAIPAPQRAGIIREAGWRFRSADLAAHLADQEPDVAMAALSRAELSVEDWSTLIPRLPVRARGFLRLRRAIAACLGADSAVEAGSRPVSGPSSWACSSAVRAGRS